jgi:hypothetical protein
LYEFVPSATGQFEDAEIIQPLTGQFVSTALRQFPKFLNITTLTNHIEIIDACKTIEEKIFYILYAYKEKLNLREMRRCLKNNTFASLMGDKHNFQIFTVLSADFFRHST